MLLALVAVATPGWSQAGGTITGQVVDATTRQPLAEVQVFVAGTARVVSTDAQGRYTLSNVPAGPVEVRASRLGYALAVGRAQLAGGQAATLDLQLAPQAVALDELVVTGTTGKSRRAEQPAVIGSVEASTLVEQGAASVADLLTGRIAGVQLSPSSGSVGTGQQIRIRGAASISLSNEPLVFVDGVRADSRTYGANEATTQEFQFGFGGQGMSRLNDINPEDIERIEVVKGPAAATLYGADASAGVIQIFTKKGKAGSNHFAQSVSAEYGRIDPNFTPFANYAVCTAAMVAPTSKSALCRDQAVGALVSDNPLLRTGLLRDGNARALNYSARGGGESYGYYVSLGLDKEDGTLPNNSLDRRSARVNFRFAPTLNLSVDAGLGLNRTVGQLPLGDSHGLGFLPASYMGSALTVGAFEDGFGSPHPGSASAVQDEMATTRYSPTLQVEYTPVHWMTHRLILGADLSRTDGEIYFPKNDEGYFTATDNAGTLLQNRNAYDSYTFDYLGTLRAELGSDVRSDLAFGVQGIADRTDALTGWGNGYVTNSTRLVSAGSKTQLVQSYLENRSLGFLGQLNLALRERLFLQLGARVDQHSAFGVDAKPFFLPKVGVSYAVSDEPFWQGVSGVIPTLRLRTAYGTTGRAPLTGAALETYSPYPYMRPDGTIGAGVVPLNPGNQALRPEKGTEFEAGFDASLLADRLGVELTYYRKSTTDLLLTRPLPPSAGFNQGTVSSPYVNIGEVRNQGLEYSLRGTLVRSPSFGWEAWVAGSTLDNELVDLGGVAPFGTTYRFVEGRPLGSLFTRHVRSVDVDTRKVVVSDTAEFVGSQLPTHEGHVGSALTYGALRLSGQLDWKAGFSIYNYTARYREALLPVPNAQIRVDTTRLSPEQRLRRYGPFVNSKGATVAASQVLEPFMEKGDFLRLRELAATLTLPGTLAKRVGAGSASLTLSGHNLGLWTDYSGSDPEVLARALMNTGIGTFQREDLFSLPQARRWVARMSFTF